MTSKIQTFLETPLLARLIRRFPAARRLQSAQGMVEFALVLPILLMLLLGIIAFSHLFFVYSMTVSSSREAARWGSAVGVSPNGVPRYRDCDLIRAEAVRTGNIVGVKAPNITITYDHGPGTATYGPCPTAGLEPYGPADADVKLGDRIIVTVNVNYTPIVPFINIPSRLLSAETARTIIKALPVGEAPVAADPCGKTPKINFATNPDISTGSIPPDTPIGITLYVTIAETGLAAPGTIQIQDDMGHSCGPANAGTGVPSCTFPAYPASMSGQAVTFSISYVSGTSCPADMPASGTYYVGAVPTTTKIVSAAPTISVPGDALGTMIQVDVSKAAPSSGAVTEGIVTIIDLNQAGVTCTIDLSATNQCRIKYPLGSTSGAHMLRASYAGFPDPGLTKYKPSVSPLFSHLVQAATPTPTATTIFTPTITMTPTITLTPTKTPLPPWCPSASAFNFAENQLDKNGHNNVLDNAIEFTVTNPAIAPSVATLNTVSVTWPDTNPSPVFTDLRVGPYTLNTCDTGAPCLWHGAIDPSNATVGAGSSNPFSDPSLGNFAIGESKELRLNFSRSLKNGKHFVTLYFSNNCILELQGDRAQ